MGSISHFFDKISELRRSAVDSLRRCLAGRKGLSDRGPQPSRRSPGRKQLYGRASAGITGMTRDMRLNPCRVRQRPNMGCEIDLALTRIIPPVTPHRGP